MLTRIYLGFIALSVIIMGTFSILCFNWLQSIGDPLAVVENYEYYAGLSWSALWFLFIAMVIFANVVLWKTGKAWPLWAAFLFFAIFIITQTFWLDRAFFNFQKEANLDTSTLFLRPFLGFTISVVAAVGIFFDQFIVLRLREKMYPKPVAEESETEIEEK